MTLNQSRRRFLYLAGGALLAGCGGGGSPAGGPNVGTRKRVETMHQALTTSARSFGFVGGTGGIGALPTFGAAEGKPLLGAFLRNVAATPPTKRSARPRKVTRNEDPGSSGGSSGSILPGPDFPYSSFYFDYYLGLWVEVKDEGRGAKFSLWVDEAKTEAAGYIETTYPDDWSVFPQVYEHRYAFTAGLLKGSHGLWKSVTREDWSGESEYENVYSDGGKDTGESNWSSRGDWSWKSRSEMPGGAWTEHTGSFRSDGTGGMRMANSEGFESIYRHNADGSGRATYTGPEESLPVTVVWDGQGNATIYYKDGTSERLEGWWWWWGGPMPLLHDNPTAATAFQDLSKS